MNTKTCRCCRQVLPLSCFSPKRDTADGRCGTCKACRSEREKQRYRTANRSPDTSARETLRQQLWLHSLWRPTNHLEDNQCQA